MPTSPDVRITRSLFPIHIDAVAPVHVGPGCIRRDLPSIGGARVWVVDMEPGSEWPTVDAHGSLGEQVFVVSGEVIEGDQTFGPGTYLLFGPGSSHRPRTRTRTGVRLFGINLQES
jgi:hypothetical protein